MGHQGRENEWLEYYQRFSYISPETVRDGSHPQIMEHAEPTDKAIILVHGLTDSPYFMRAIADFFFEELGYNVYLPLLRGHGLKNPQGMIRVRLKDWKANIEFAIEKASKKTAHLSIGGLSAGGALSFYTACTNEHITGSLYLFSAALDIAGGVGGIMGEIAERLLRTPIAKLMYMLDKKKPLINENPFRYARMDKGGAIQLGRLIKANDRIIHTFQKKKIQFPKRVFAAHSKGDHAAHIDGIKTLYKIANPENFKLFIVPESISHASIVLKNPIYADSAEDVTKQEAPLEKANPLFDAMMEAIAEFEREETFTN